MAFSATIPGTGLSFREQLGSGGSPPFEPWGGSPRLPLLQDVSAAEATPIQSGGSGALTTPGLGEFRRLLGQARQEHEQILKELATARVEEATKVGKCNRWTNGWLLKKLRPKRYTEIQLAAEEASDLRVELEEQAVQSRLSTQIDLPDGVSQTFHRVCDEFALLAKSARIWDTLSERDTNKALERTTADRRVQRKLVSFSLQKCEVLETEWQVPHLGNANGGDLYLYPAFVLYFISVEQFALLEYKELEFADRTTQFQEEDGIPPDSKVIGQTWAKANKDGSPDKRFKDNYPIPVAAYGCFTFRSATGLNEEFMISNSEQSSAFGKALRALIAAVGRGV